MPRAQAHEIIVGAQVVQLYFGESFLQYDMEVHRLVPLAPQNNIRAEIPSSRTLRDNFVKERDFWRVMSAWRVRNFASQPFERTEAEASPGVETNQNVKRKV